MVVHEALLDFVATVVVTGGWHRLRRVRRWGLLDFEAFIQFGARVID